MKNSLKNSKAAIKKLNFTIDNIIKEYKKRSSIIYKIKNIMDSIFKRG